MPPKQDTAVAETFTDDELDGLSEEERAALDYEEPGQEETASTKEDETSGADAEVDGAGEGEAPAPVQEPEKQAADDDKGAAAKDAGADQAQAGEAEEASGEGDQEQGAEDTATQQGDISKIQEDYTAEMTRLDEEYAGLGKSVEDGDMTFAEYHVKVKEINDAKMQARVSFEDDMQWQRAQSTFFADEANQVFLDPMRQTFLQATIDKMYKDGEMNGLDYGSAIAKAAEKVRGALNLGADTAAPKVEAKKKPAKPQPKIPQTLGDVPPADDNAIEPNKFGHLDGLEGDDLEAALAKMSTAEVDAWLDSAG